MNTFHTGIIEQHGERYRVEYAFDHYHGAPWEDDGGHGVVSEWTRRDKRPSERVLNTDGTRSRFYDIKASLEIAKRDDWGRYGFQTTGTKGQHYAEQVERDFKYLKEWCGDKWHYMGIIVTLLCTCDKGHDHATEYQASLWSIESNGDLSTYVQDLIGNVESDRAHHKAA